MDIALTLEKEHSFRNQIRREFLFPRGVRLFGKLHLFASTWPFGVIEHDHPGKLGVEFTFAHESRRWLHRAFINSSRLWPTAGSKVSFPADGAAYAVGPLAGMRDDREDFYYTLPDGSDRRFGLKYIGFQCWLSVCGEHLDVKLQHFLPGDHQTEITYSLPIETILFQRELRLSYDNEGFLEDAYESPFVRVEDCQPSN